MSSRRRRFDDDKVAVHIGEGHTVEGVVLGRVGNMGLTVVRVEGLNRPALKAAAEPKPGHLAVAVGRTWSGGVMAAFAPVSVVGGPHRTGAPARSIASFASSSHHTAR